MTRLQVCSNLQSGSLYHGHLQETVKETTLGSKTPLFNLLSNLLFIYLSVLEGPGSYNEVKLRQPATFIINKRIRYRVSQSFNGVLWYRPLTTQTCLVSYNELKLFPCKETFDTISWKSLVDNKSLLVQSTKTLMLMQHQQQTTLQMNICAPYWADCPISSECRMPHAKSPSVSQSTKLAILYPQTAKIVDGEQRALFISFVFPQKVECVISGINGESTGNSVNMVARTKLRFSMTTSTWLFF